MSGRIASAVGSIVAPRRRAFRWIFGVLVAALVAAMASMPFLVNGDAAKRAIERQLTALTGGDFRYAALDLKVWPRPTAELRQVTFRVAPVVEGAADRIVLRLAFLPLLAGDVRVAIVELERPALSLRIPATGAARMPDDPVASYRSTIGPTLEWLALHARGLAISVRDGSVDLDLPGAPPLKLDSVLLDGEVASGSIEAKVAAHANLWKGARAHVMIDTDSLAGSVELEIQEFDAASAVERLLDASSVRVRTAPTDVTLAAQTDGRRSASAKLSVAAPAFGITRNDARLDLGPSDARIQATYAPDETTLRVEALKLGDLLPAGSGSLRVRPGAGGTVLEAVLGRVDAGRLREGAIKVAGDVASVRELAAIVQGGIVQNLRVAVAGNDVKVLADPSSYDVSMGVEEARIDVPVPAMALARASGNVRIARGVLTASGVAATFGASTLKNGELVLALGPAIALRSLAVALDLDLAENHAQAVRLLRDSPVAPGLGRIESIAGRARGTLALAEAGAGFRQTYDVTSLNATIRRVGAPLPIAIDSGGLRYETGGTLLLRGIAGAFGSSRVTRLDAEIGFAPGPVVRAASGTGVLALDELYPWAIALPVARSFRGELAALQGSVEFKVARLAGPLNAPERLEIDAALVPRKIRIASRRLPDQLTIDGGTLRLQNQDLLGEGVEFAVRDMRGTVSGSLRGFASAARALDVSVARATIGPRGLEWIEKEAGLARGAWLQAPIRLDEARVRWPAPAPWRFEVTAAASFAGGARSEVDMSYRPGSLAIRRLTLKDQDSDSTVALDWQPERAGMAFHGYVSGRSIARLLAAPPPASGTLRGDFEATVDLVEPVRSRATGKLQGRDVGLPALFDVPLAIERIALEADGERVRVQDTVLRLADEPLTLSGSIARAGDGLVVDGDIVAEGVDARRWLDRLRDEGASVRRWPVNGRVGVRARHVDVEGYRLEPFAAVVAFGERKVTAEVTDARLCGIAVPFTATATGETLEVKGRAAGQDLPVAAAIACLSRNMFRASGTMDVSADFAASGAPASLPASARGNARLRARDGRIGGVRALSGVLRLDDVSERLPGPELDSAREGLPYAVIEIDARLAGERTIIDRALLESPALNIAMQGEVGLADGKVALTGIALPIVNVNALLRRVPIVGMVVGDPIIGIPFSVSGDFGDPKVTKIGAAAIAGALLNTLQSVVSLPVQLLGIGAGSAATVTPTEPPASGRP